MKRRLNRDINIFSISALDLFASAMGAFILLTVILFPYYQKHADFEKQLSELRSQLAQTQQQLQKCHDRLSYTFLSVVLKWETQNQDVDLHVIDTEGHEFYYQQHNRGRAEFPAVDAELSVDTIKGPGVEIWENSRAKPGIYKIYANLYSRHHNSENPVVKSNLYYRDGAKKLPDLTLTQEGPNQKKLIAVVEVNSEGEVVILQ
jgi:uncharacterized protein YfaP (DUF2135 family)